MKIITIHNQADGSLISVSGPLPLLADVYRRYVLDRPDALGVYYRLDGVSVAALLTEIGRTRYVPGFDPEVTPAHLKASAFLDGEAVAHFCSMDEAEEYCERHNKAR